MTAPQDRQPATERETKRETLRRYRDTFLRIATECGDDTSGIEHPDQLAFPDISELALEAVMTLREDYRAALDETEQAVREARAHLIAELRESVEGLPQPTLGLAGGVSRAAVLSLIEKASGPEGAKE